MTSAGCASSLPPAWMWSAPHGWTGSTEASSSKLSTTSSRACLATTCAMPRAWSRSCAGMSQATHTRAACRCCFFSHTYKHTHTTAPQQAQCALPLARLLPSQRRDCAGSEEGSLRGMEGGLAAAVCSFPCVQLVLTTSPPRAPFMHRFDLFQQQVAQVRSGAACCGKA